MDQITKYLSTIGKRGGKSKSAAKVSASRANGLKGGRPKKDKQIEDPNSVNPSPSA